MLKVYVENSALIIRTMQKKNAPSKQIQHFFNFSEYFLFDKKQITPS